MALIKTNEKAQKIRQQKDVQASLKFQKEPSLDDSFWSVGVQTNYFYKKNFGIKCLVKGSRSKEIKAKKRQKNKTDLENL